MLLRASSDTLKSNHMAEELSAGPGRFNGSIYIYPLFRHEHLFRAFIKEHQAEKFSSV